MVHYIRFLKYPYFVRSENSTNKWILKAKITITTDLGESFYPDDVCVYVAVCDSTVTTRLDAAQWRAGFRILEIETNVPSEIFDLQARLQFTCNQTLELDTLQLDRLPRIISAWTHECELLDLVNPDELIRRFRSPNDQILEIREANRETIAHHIWDGGLILTAWLLSCPDCLESPIGESCTVLELGTGCGIVSLAFGATRRQSSLILTDLDVGALVYAKRNARGCRALIEGAWHCTPLDWAKPHEFDLSQPLDFIIASECIYNSDSIPDLVRTLSTLARQSGALAKESAWPKLIMSTKVRHHSESIFYEEMNQSGFRRERHIRIPVPDSYRESIGQELEQVDIFIFEYRLTY
ncbi:MAG: hypothetical protein Q9222_007230 [Ikaeria aurantiellina]